MTTAVAPTRDEIIALETAYWDAMKQKDGGRAAELSGETTLVTGARGVSSIERSKMGAMTEDSSWRLDSYELEDVEVAAPASNVAIIAYTVRQRVTMDGKAQDKRAADSSTWVRGDDGWACHAHSEVFLPEGKAG